MDALHSKTHVDSVPWKTLVDDPGNRFYRYPIARVLVRGLVHTSITPNQVTFLQLPLAAAAAWLLALGNQRAAILAAIVFECRSILDCADGTLARAKNMASPSGHAIDGLADWLSACLLYVGIYLHLRENPPPPLLGILLPVGPILILALTQAALRSFAADYHQLKFGSVFELGRDETVVALREKILRARQSPSFFAHADVFIGQMGHLVFRGGWLDVDKHDDIQGPNLQTARHSHEARWIARIWSVSNGDTFLTIVMASFLLGQLWLTQVFFAFVGPLWVVLAVFTSRSLMQAATRSL